MKRRCGRYLRHVRSLDFEMDGTRVTAMRQICLTCGVLIPYGPSNDEPEAVQIEIAATWMASRFAPLDGRSNMTRDGWYCHRDGYMPNHDTAGG
jgi:hypothetical protein